ncbi:putative bifunctional diguanylate cyclase/phosphodiesterase [Umezawaea tangerina]|uniref:PAS domain S-box-containing protein/diguanylate cyclase (GGDEF)-like protein n=1 Tax=Umezawaea tangerina TaxID=84725 RepID=A0A2T0TE82_9PSEU|nr:EAL domain-containing protein [Umezawaea tangerina]PRY43976.1 PAS domain S-box-containing protein/diguanylate cyclase (GGDEF)-like protein [Umezawaea tangerina]
MAMVDHSGATPDPGTALDEFPLVREDFAHRWTALISATVLANISRPELEQLLAALTTQLLKAISADPEDPEHARRIGRAMVEHDFIASETLERSVAFVGEHLLTHFHLPASWNGRLMRLLGSLAAGFSDGLRDRTLDQQELSKTAAVIATRRAQQAQHDSETKFRAVFNSSAVSIAVIGLDDHLLDFNEALVGLLRHPAADLRKLTAGSLMHPDDRASLALAVDQLASGEVDHLRGERRMLRHDGEVVEVLLALSLVRTPAGEPAYYVAMIENMNELRALQTQLVRQSLHDVQTGLANRAQYLGWLENAAGSKGPDTIVLAHFDIDGFRVVNDAFGHDVGNRILVEVANHLRAVFDGVGQVARIGPDEFGVLVRDPKDTRSVIVLVENALELLAEPVYVEAHGIAVTASVGVVARRSRGADASELLRCADITLGWAKADGKAQWALYDRERDLRDRDMCVLAASIPGGLELGEFRVDYQPVVRLSDRALVAVEAKLRWDHPDRGVLDPDQFMPLTTSTGMVMRLSRWVLERACEDAGRWYAEFGDAAPLMSVDLIARHCQEPELVAEIGGLLQRTGVPPKLLQFELHETLPAIITDEQADELDILSSRGVRLVLDQLTGGAVTSKRVREIPLHGIKFAGSIVSALAGGANLVDESAATSLIRWSGVLRKPLLADGVHDETVALRLAELGVTFAQGPLFGEAVDAAAIRAVLAG